MHITTIGLDIAKNVTVRMRIAREKRETHAASRCSNRKKP